MTNHVVDVSTEPCKYRNRMDSKIIKTEHKGAINNGDSTNSLACYLINTGQKIF